MQLRSRGISEPICFVYNPLPKIREDVLLDAAGLSDLFTSGRGYPFSFTWKYASGLQMETVEIEPGQFLALRESEAKEFERATNALELGLCVVPHADVANPETKKIAIQALTRAMRFYFEGGQKQLIDQRKRHSYSEEDMEEQKSRFYPYHLNRAKERAIKEHIERMKAPTTKAAAK